LTTQDTQRKSGPRLGDRLRAALRAAGRGVRRSGAFVARHWRAALVVAAIVIFAVGPGFTASRPEFYKRFEKLTPYYESWMASQHARVNCQSCHVAPEVLDQAVYHAAATGEIYLSLLPLGREPNLLPRPTNEACESCHIDLRTVSPSGDLNIPHRAHVDKLKVACVTCHADLVHAAGTDESTKPRMQTCLRCHDGVTAKSECNACHREKDRPESHGAKDWLVVHPERQNQEDCAKCHGWNDAWCAECHSNRPESHGSGDKPAVWRAAHGKAVEDRRNCEACHQAAFCERCHGEVPQLNYDATLKLVE